MPKLKLAILGSTRGTSMQAIIDAINQQQVDAQIELVLSNKVDAPILARAQAQQLNAVFIAAPNRQEFETKLSALLQAYEIDLLLLIGFMRILSPDFVQQWANKVLNVHPSLLPQFAGLNDRAVHQAVLVSGQRYSGCTVHYVSAEVDKGPILMQQQCLVAPNESVDSLKAKVQVLEGKALIAAIRCF